MARLLIQGVVVPTLLGVIGCWPVLGSTVVVPDGFSTVQSAIDSGADTVLIRAGSYPERPFVDHAVVLQGIGIGERPRLDGLDISNANFWTIPPLLSVERIDFSGRVDHTTVNYTPRLLELAFSESALERGIYQVLSTDPDDVALLSIRNCRLGGYSSARAYQVIMEADTIVGDVAWALREASISNCRFLGGATGIKLTDAPRGIVARNYIENYNTGIDIRGAELAVEHNTIRHCGMGVRVSGEWSEIRHNNIVEVNTGIYALAYDVRIRQNTIVGGVGPGIRVEDVALLVLERNIIGKHGGGGMLAEWWDSGSSAVMYGNTLFRNGGSGVELVQPPGYCAVEKNIGFENEEWGLKVEASGVGQVACNDWFGNGLGSVSGVAVGASDLSVDPLFCNADSADVGLLSASPLVNASGCGQIGALGVGCGITATVIQRFTAERVTAGIQVVWQVAESATASEVWVERSEAMEGGAWARPLTERSIDNQVVVELDRSAASDRAYRYRLMALEGNEVTVIGPPIIVEGQARLDSRLVEMGPNPGGGPVRIAFALQHSGTIEVDVFDIQGRSVASLARGTWPAGTHELEWNGRTRGWNPAPAGVYVVRYVYPGGQDKRAIVRVR